MPSARRTSKFHQLIGWTAAMLCALFGVTAFAQGIQGHFDGVAGGVLITLLLGWLARGFIRDTTYEHH